MREGKREKESKREREREKVREKEREGLVFSKDFFSSDENFRGKTAEDRFFLRCIKSADFDQRCLFSVLGPFLPPCTDSKYVIKNCSRLVYNLQLLFEF